MAYYISGEKRKGYMGQVYIGSNFVTQEQHQRIIDNKNAFRNVANNYTIDIELSRKNGVETHSPQIQEVTIGCQIIHRGEDITLAQLKESTYVMYWLNCYAETPQAISSHESNKIETMLSELFQRLLAA